MNTMNTAQGGQGVLECIMIFMRESEIEKGEKMLIPCASLKKTGGSFRNSYQNMNLLSGFFHTRPPSPCEKS